MSQATLGGEPFQNSKLFSSYYLSDRIADLDDWECDTEARDAFERLQNLWELEYDLVSAYEEDELLDAWIDKVIEVLGFDSLSETTLPDAGGYTDRLLFDSPGTRRDAATRKKGGDREAMFGLASAVLEAKQWDADFTTKFDEQRSYRDASHQIKYYLERTPERLQWGILTNGRKWRLYGTKDYATEIYYEVDLPELLESGDIEQFKYFFAFFRREAFRETAGTSFLDTVWAESETAAQQLGEDLQDNVFTALRVLGEGFIETNDLDIDPADSEARAELKEQSLVLLYRLMFILYAESRGLIHPDEPAKQVEYEEHFSLEQQLLDIHEDITAGDSYEDFSGYSTGLWGRLEDLFALIDEGEEDLGIPPYNGGLFDSSTHEFLAQHEVADRYLAEVIHRLGTTEGEDGKPAVADYADLDTRHLGSIYEGLLEHEFRIAPEQYAAVSADGGEVWKPATEVSVAVETVDEGGLYVVNDDGERKATGAYYTPDYVVSYIIEETIDPLIDEIKADLSREGLLPGDMGYFGGFYSRLLQLRVLDPAMGSAHFLTSATAYLTEQVMAVSREQEQGHDEQEIRRTIAKECIYGVDINGMAVELGKLSMWLETLAADKPLAFLDHHLKAGNSLVGSDITEVLADDSENGSGQLTLSQSFARARQQTLGHVMELMQDLLAIDNDALVDIKSMEELYDEIRDDPLYKRLFEIANVHTAEQFGVEVPEGAYEEMASAIDDTKKWAKIQDEDWFRSAQMLADEQSFFHWELEYPEVFFNAEGEQMDEAGFDAVVGNPPYVRVQRIQPNLTQYLFSEYKTCSSKTDLSLPFIELGINLIDKKGTAAYISTSQWLSTDYGKVARKYFSSGKISKIVDFHTLPVFKIVSTYPSIFVIKKGGQDILNYAEITDKSDLNIDALRGLKSRGISYDQLGENSWVLDELDIRATIKKRTQTEPLSQFGHFHIGAITGLDDVFVVGEDTIENENLERDLIYPYAHRNKEIERYATTDPDHLIIYPYYTNEGDSKLISQDELESEYSGIYEYLCSHRDDLSERKDSQKYYARGDGWYQFLRPGRFDYIEAEKLLFRGLAKQTCVGWLKEGTVFSGNNCPGFISDSEKYSDEYLLALLNSTLLSEYLVQISPAKMQDYSRFNAGDLNQTPIKPIRFDDEYSDEETLSAATNQYENYISNESKNIDTTDILETLSSSVEIHEFITHVVSYLTKLVDRLSELNLSLLDHLGAYDDGPTLAEIGLSQPPRGSADSILQQTATEKPNLRVGTASVVRESTNTVEIRLTARYKPAEDDTLDESEFEVDQWGYTETDPQPALRLTDLTETEADLIAAFVPVAVDEAGGFAGFRETATKTNSLVGRLRKLTLPRVADVESGLAGYLETKERAEELEAKIESTDALIDEIVYELYGLTDEEIEIVEEAVGE